MWHIASLKEQSHDNATSKPFSNIEYVVGRIQDILLGENDEDSMTNRLFAIEEEIKKIDKMQDQLALIIKLLGKHE